jgi:hypothetical protein
MEGPGMASKPKGRPKKPAAGPVPRRKVTLLLDVETAKKLHHAAVERGLDLGQVAGPLIDAGLANEYYAVRTAPPPRLALADGTTPVAAGLAIVDLEHDVIADERSA